MSAIYWEQTPVQCAYVSVCTTKACLLLFSLISNHNGATFYYHFLSVPVEHFTTSIQRDVYLAMQCLMIISWKSHTQAWQCRCWKGQLRLKPQWGASPGNRVCAFFWNSKATGVWGWWRRKTCHQRTMKRIKKKTPGNQILLDFLPGRGFNDQNVQGQRNETKTNFLFLLCTSVVISKRKTKVAKGAWQAFVLE